jgi:cell division protease FtsH
MEKKAQVELLAEALLEKEVLFQSDVEALIGKRPYEEKKVLDVAVETTTKEEIKPEVKPAERPSPETSSDAGTGILPLPA